MLLDLARHLGRPWLAVGPGDFVLLRTGHLAMVRDRDDWGDYAGGASPGGAVDAVEFFLVAPPLTTTGSVGSPINPQAIK